MKVTMRKPITMAAIAAGIALLMAGSFVAGRGYPFERASAKASEGFQVVDQSVPSSLPPATAPWHAQPSDPFQRLAEIQREMDEMFSRTFGQMGAGPSLSLNFGGISGAPDLDLRDEGDSYVARLDMPGIETGSIDVQVMENQLTISGTRVAEQEHTSGNLLRKERQTGTFTRSLTLPEKVDPASVGTDYKDGVLTVRVKKAAGN